MMGAFGSVIQFMADMNLFHLFFPWLFVLAVTYGLLQQHEVFSDDPSVNGMIALSMAFLTVGGAAAFVPAGMFTHFAAALAFGLFGIIGLLILQAAAGVDLAEELGGSFDLPAIGALIIVIVAFIAVIGQYLNIEAILGGVSGGNVFDQVVMPILVLVFLLIVVALTAGDA